MSEEEEIEIPYHPQSDITKFIPIEAEYVSVAKIGDRVHVIFCSVTPPLDAEGHRYKVPLGHFTIELGLAKWLAERIIELLKEEKEEE